MLGRKVSCSQQILRWIPAVTFALDFLNFTDFAPRCCSLWWVTLFYLQRERSCGDEKSATSLLRKSNVQVQFSLTVVEVPVLLLASQGERLFGMHMEAQNRGMEQTRMCLKWLKGCVTTAGGRSRACSWGANMEWDISSNCKGLLRCVFQLKSQQPGCPSLANLKFQGQYCRGWIFWGQTRVLDFLQMFGSILI